MAEAQGMADFMCGNGKEIKCPRRVSISDDRVPVLIRIHIDDATSDVPEAAGVRIVVSPLSENAPLTVNGSHANIDNLALGRPCIANEIQVADTAPGMESRYC